MNRSYSKIRNIQESNLKLEKQFIKESSDNVQNKIIQTISSLKKGGGGLITTEGSLDRERYRLPYYP